jgi:uncharacterized NAD(P)/FAD-binding protein YdhS
VVPDGSGFLVTSHTGTRWRVGAVVNCCGPGGAAGTDLGRALLAAGTARPDPLGLGLDVDGQGRLVCAAGQPDDRIFVIGPPRRGRWWETTAVPEIRAQAVELTRRPPGSSVRRVMGTTGVAVA